MITIFNILLIIAALLLVGNFKLKLRPFSASLSEWKMSLAYVLILSGLIIMHITVYDRGWSDCYNKMMEVLDNHIKNQQL